MKIRKFGRTWSVLFFQTSSSSLLQTEAFDPSHFLPQLTVRHSRVEEELGYKFSKKNFEATKISIAGFVVPKKKKKKKLKIIRDTKEYRCTT